MKFSVYAQHSKQPEHSVGHQTAASALADVRSLKEAGAAQIQIFDTRTGRLIDETALLRAEGAEQFLSERQPKLRDVASKYR